SRACAHQLLKPVKHEDPPRRGRLRVADEERCPVAFGHTEPSIERWGNDLSSKGGPLEHVQATRQVLWALQARQVGASRQLGELAPRQAQREKISFNQLGTCRQRKAELRARSR